MQLIWCTDIGDIDNEIEEEKKKQQELDAQIREMEKKLREKQMRSDRKTGSGRGSAGGGGSAKKGSSAKSTNQRNARRLEDQLQLVTHFISYYIQRDIDNVIILQKVSNDNKELPFSASAIICLRQVHVKLLGLLFSIYLNV